MITKKVQDLFDFIDWLHSQTNYLLTKQPLIDEVLQLDIKRNVLKPNANFRDKLEYDKIQSEIKIKYDEVASQTTDLIRAKINQFNIADVSQPIINLSAQNDLFELQRNFTDLDLQPIFKARDNYIDFRAKTKFHYFLSIFFHDLDRSLKEFFEYFSYSDNNELELLEPKTIKVESIEEAVAVLTGKPFAKPQPEPLPQTLADLITSEYSSKIVEGIKIQYRNIQGKRLKILLLALQDLKLLPTERVAKDFHTRCQSEFDWNIASYTAMNDYKFNEMTDKHELEAMKDFVSNLNKP